MESKLLIWGPCKICYPPVNSVLSVMTRLRGGRRREMVRIPMGAQDFTVFQSVQTAPEDQPPSYSVDIEGCFLRGKAAGACAAQSPPSRAKINKENSCSVCLKACEWRTLSCFVSLISDSWKHKCEIATEIDC